MAQVSGQLIIWASYGRHEVETEVGRVVGTEKHAGRWIRGPSMTIARKFTGCACVHGFLVQIFKLQVKVAVW